MNRATLDGAAAWASLGAVFQSTVILLLILMPLVTRGLNR